MQLSKEEYVRKRIHNGSSVLIENSVTRVTFQHHSASFVMPNSYIRDGFFKEHLTTIKDSYNLISIQDETSPCEKGTYQQRLRQDCLATRLPRAVNIGSCYKEASDKKPHLRHYWVAKHAHLENRKPHNARVLFLMRRLNYPWASVTNLVWSIYM